jgi:hypothetical protein
MTRIFIAIAAAALAFVPSAQANTNAPFGTVEADNGEVYRIVALQIPYDRLAPIHTEVYDNDGQLVVFQFDYRGHFLQQTSGFGGERRNKLGGKAIARERGQRIRPMRRPLSAPVPVLSACCA